MSRHYFPWMKLQKDTYRDPAIIRLTNAQRGIFYGLLQWAARQEDQGTFDDTDRRSLALEVADEDEAELAATIDRLLQFQVLIRRDDSRLTFRRYEAHQATKKDQATVRQRDSRMVRDAEPKAEKDAPPHPVEERHTSVTKRDEVARSVTQRDYSLSTSHSLSLSKQASIKKNARKRNEKVADPDPEVMASLKELGLRVTRHGHALLVKVRDKHLRVDFPVAALSTLAYIRETRGDDATDDEVIDAICSALARYDAAEWSRYWRDTGGDMSAAFEAPTPDDLGPHNTQLWGELRLVVAERLRGNYPLYFGEVSDRMQGDGLVLMFVDATARAWAANYGDVVSQCAESCGYPGLEIEYTVLGDNQRAAG